MGFSTYFNTFVDKYKFILLFIVGLILVFLNDEISNIGDNTAYKTTSNYLKISGYIILGISSIGILFSLKSKLIKRKRKRNLKLKNRMN